MKTLSSVEGWCVSVFSFSCSVVLALQCSRDTVSRPGTLYFVPKLRGSRPMFLKLKHTWKYVSCASRSLQAGFGTPWAQKRASESAERGAVHSVTRRPRFVWKMEIASFSKGELETVLCESYYNSHPADAKFGNILFQKAERYINTKVDSDVTRCFYEWDGKNRSWGHC